MTAVGWPRVALRRRNALRRVGAAVLLWMAAGCAGDRIAEATAADTGPGPIMVRMHAVDLLDDMTASPHWISVHNSMHMIAQAGRGVVVFIREHRRTALAERVRKLSQNATPGRVLRDYGIGAQILLDLGVRRMVLL